MGPGYIIAHGRATAHRETAEETGGGNWAYPPSEEAMGESGF